MLQRSIKSHSVDCSTRIDSTMMDDFPGSGHHSEASPDSAVFVGRYDDLRRSVSEDMKVYTKAMPHGLKKVHSSLPTTLKSKIPVGQRSGVMASEQKNAKVKALGHLRLRDEDTNEVILVPTPSYDPKDPLNWYLSVVALIFLQGRCC